ncbi:MAG: hypothetical protein HYY49_14525 [Ignavibacteriales bacterium]|nr:hypothetical protein [Ignavibacteriales bacterium]
MLDNLLLLVVGVLSTLALLFAGMCLYFAVKNAKKKDGEVSMALWSFGALAGFTFAGMCWAYFLIPILIHKLF